MTIYDSCQHNCLFCENYERDKLLKINETYQHNTSGDKALRHYDKFNKQKIFNNPKSVPTNLNINRSHSNIKVCEKSLSKCNVTHPFDRKSSYSNTRKHFHRKKSRKKSLYNESIEAKSCIFNLSYDYPFGSLSKTRLEAGHSPSKASIKTDYVKTNSQGVDAAPTLMFPPAYEHRLESNCISRTNYDTDVRKNTSLAQYKSHVSSPEKISRKSSQSGKSSDEHYTSKQSLLKKERTNSSTKSNFGEIIVSSYDERKKFYSSPTSCVIPPSYDNQSCFNENKSSFSERKPFCDTGKNEFHDNKPQYNENKLPYNNNKTFLKNQPSCNESKSYDESKPSYNECNQSYSESKPSYNISRPSYNESQQSYNESKPSYNESKPSYESKSSYNESKQSYNESKPSYFSEESKHPSHISENKKSYDDRRPSYEKRPQLYDAETKEFYNENIASFNETKQSSYPDGIKASYVIKSCDNEKQNVKKTEEELQKEIKLNFQKVNAQKRQIKRKQTCFLGVTDSTSCQGKSCNCIICLDKHCTHMEVMTTPEDMEIRKKIAEICIQKKPCSLHPNNSCSVTSCPEAIQITESCRNYHDGFAFSDIFHNNYGRHGEQCTRYFLRFCVLCAFIKLFTWSWTSKEEAAI